MNRRANCTTDKNMNSVLGLVIALTVAGCSDEPGAEDATGMVDLAIVAVPGVSSVSVTFAGNSRSVTRCVAVDNQPVTRIQGLPSGTVHVAAAAFPSPECEGDATWLAEEETYSFLPGAPTSVRIVFRPNGIAEIDTSFVDDVALCGPNLDRVPVEAMAYDAMSALGTGLRAVYDDGDVRAEGPLFFGPYDAGDVPSYYPADVLADESAPALWQTIWGIGGETLTGFITGPRTGSVSFTISGDDYVSLDLGNGLLTVLADNIGSASGTVTLEAGVRYPVTLRYENRWGSNWFRFYWQCP